MMVVPSLAVNVWKVDDMFWGSAPWLDEPISAPTWEELLDKAMRIRAAKMHTKRY